MEAIKDFAENVTAHGIFRILSAKRLAVKCFWLILFLASSAYLIYQVVEIAKSFGNYHVITKTETTFETKLQFPSVTLCPTNANNRNYTRENARNETKMKEIINMTDKGRTLIWSYSFAQIGYSYPTHFKTVLIPGIGLCYTFNPDGSLFQDRAGSLYGLEAWLYVTDSDIDQLDDLVNGKGVFISVHHPDEISFPNLGGIGLAPGFSNIISLKRKTMIRQKAPYPSNCTDGSKNRQIFPGRYTLSTCQVSCMELEALKRCGSTYGRTIPLYLLEEQKKLLSPDLSLASNCLFEPSVLNYLLEAKCDCQIPCTEDKYEKTLSFIRWPSIHQMNNIRQQAPSDVDISEAILNKKLLKISVFYGEMTHEIITEAPEWTFTSLLSDIGGTMGIWLGASIFSLTELFILTGYLPYSLFRATGKKNIVNVAPAKQIVTH